MRNEDTIHIQVNLPWESWFFECACYEWVSCFALSFCSSPSNRSVSTLLPLFLSSLTSHSYQLVANRFFPLLLCAPRSGWCFWFLRALDFGFCLGLLFARLTNHNSSSLVIIHHHHHHPLHLHYFIHHLFILLKKIFFLLISIIFFFLFFAPLCQVLFSI